MLLTDATPYERAHFIQLMCLAAGFSGASMKEIRAATDLSETAAGYWLCVLRDAGAIEQSTLFGHMVRWGPPGTWAHHAAWREKMQKQRTRREDRKAGEIEHAHWAKRPFVNRLRVASECEPIKKTCPASVWEMAA